MDRRFFAGGILMNATTVRHILDTIAGMFPDAHCELNHNNAFELTIAVLLSAQCTDATVNKVTADLFQKYHTPQDYISVPLEELEQDIRRIGLYRNKAKHIQNLCQILIEQYGGEVPGEHDLLVQLPGVGRKTANVVVSNAFDVPAFAVDTHVERVSKRLGLANWKDNVTEVENKLNKRVPREEWTISHHRFIFSDGIIAKLKILLVRYVHYWTFVVKAKKNENVFSDQREKGQTENLKISKEKQHYNIKRGRTL